MSDTTAAGSSGPEIISPELISLDTDLGSTKEDVIRSLAARLTAAGRASDAAGLVDAALAREAQSATGLPGGIAIPHCRAEAVSSASLGFARLDPKVDFGAPDGPADLVFLIAAPEGAGAEHMKLLSSLARALVRPAFVTSLREASTPDEIVRLVDEVLNPHRRILQQRLRQRHPGTRFHRETRYRGDPGTSARGASHRRGHRVPDRNRSHLHGGGLARRRG
ncbi:hypothetical protein GCM10020255_076570 [Rhodococcus baikonurensis]